MAQELIPAEVELAEAEQFANSLTGLCDQLNMFGVLGPTISQADTMWNNNRWYLISNLRQLLSQIYVEHGIVQTLIDQPVDDAFRAGFEIKSSQLDGNDIEKIMVYCKRHGVIAAIMQAIKWGRLYGGGAIIPVLNQNPSAPLKIEYIDENTPLEFRAVDLWELYYGSQNVQAEYYVGGTLGANTSDYYDYYGIRLHKSRVMRIVGKEAPSFIRPRLRGWGMSELERLVRSLNQYLKNQDVIFELLDEAKVDVYRIKGYNSSLMTKAGTTQVAQRIQSANQIKNYNNALTMDKEDEWEQKQITFTGLAEVLLQVRQGIAADLKMPMTKIFGISAAGFNSGEDDIENYNSMIEGEIRNKNEYLVVDVLGIVCQKLFGFIPEDLGIAFNPLRMLNAKEEEEVKDSQFARGMGMYSQGVIDRKTFAEAINKDSLLGVEVDEDAEALPPIGMDPTEDLSSDKAGKPAKGKSDDAAPTKPKKT